MALRSAFKAGPRTKRLQEAREDSAEIAQQRVFVEMICLNEHICAMALDQQTLMQIPNQWLSPQIH